MSLEVQGHTVSHWKGLSSGKYEPRWLRCSSTLNICQAFLKSVNLPHKWGIGPFPMASTVVLYGWKVLVQGQKKYSNLQIPIENFPFSEVVAGVV